MVAATVLAVPPDPGPAVPLRSVTDWAVNRACTLPSPQPVAVTVKVVPGWAPVTENVQPLAVPPFVRSPPVSPVICSLNDSPNVWVVPLVGLVEADVHDATGGPSTGSTAVEVAAVTFAAGPAFPASSAMVPASRRAWTVPGEQLLTAMVRTVPELADGVNVHPVEVPAFVKSSATTPLTASLKVSV